MCEIFLSEDSHDKADSLTVGILHFIHQIVSHFFHIFNFLSLTTLLMSSFCFCLLLESCHKWNEGEGAQCSLLLPATTFIHHVNEIMKVTNEAATWFNSFDVTNNEPGMFCPIVLHVKSVPQVLSGAIRTNGLKWKEWGNLSTTIFSRICLARGWW